MDRLVLKNSHWSHLMRRSKHLYAGTDKGRIMNRVLSRNGTCIVFGSRFSTQKPVPKKEREMAHSRKVDPNETATTKLKKAYGPGCKPPKKEAAKEKPEDFLNGVKPEDAHQFYNQIHAATELLELKAGKEEALGFLRNALRRLNEHI